MDQEKIGDGRLAEVYAWGEGRVVKLFRPEFGTDLTAEATRIAQLITAVGAPAPRCHGTVEIEGRVGVVFDRMDGPLHGEQLAVDDPIALIGDFARLHARIHTFEAPNLPSFESMMTHVTSGLETEIVEAVSQRVADLDDGVTLLHADYHPFNVMRSGAEWLAIDWDAACHGPRAAGVARSQFLLMEAQPPDETMVEPVESLRSLLGTTYLDAYNEAFPIDLAEVGAWRLPILAARLWEEVPGESDFLLAEIRNEMS